MLQSHHFRSGEEPEATLDRYVWLYNQQLPQSALGSKTPLQTMKDWHKLKPALFKDSHTTVRDATGNGSRDITKLMGPVKWSYFYLYVILDIDRRRVVGWRIEHAESASQFKALFIDAMGKHAVPRDQLTLQADRGAPMKAKATALMLADLGVLKSHSRPHTSNDNPFPEAHFKTLKYQPEFPGRFETIDEARALCRRFFAWYNEDHHHAGIGLMTPGQIHFGQAMAIYAARQQTLDTAFLSTPERFVRKPPKPPHIPTAVWINPPKKTEENQA